MSEAWASRTTRLPGCSFCFIGWTSADFAGTGCAVAAGLGEGSQSSASQVVVLVDFLAI